MEYAHKQQAEADLTDHAVQQTQEKSQLHKPAAGYHGLEGPGHRGGEKVQDKDSQKRGPKVDHRLVVGKDPENLMGEENAQAGGEGGAGHGGRDGQHRAQKRPARSVLRAPKFCPIIEADAVSMPWINTSRNF